MRAMLILLLALTSCSSEPTEVDQDQAEFEAKLKRIEPNALADIESDAPFVNKEVLDEQIATVLNLNGLLCASIVAVQPLAVRPNVYEVTCVEYRGGSGQIRYILDAAAGTALKAG